jgi:hypothetical protein
MAVTLNLDPRSNSDHKLPSKSAQGFKIITGSFDYGATSGAGVSFDIAQLNTVLGCWVEPHSGYMFHYDAGTLKAYTGGVHVSLTSSAAMAVVATGVAMATCSSLSFMAWGYE